MNDSLPAQGQEAALTPKQEAALAALARLSDGVEYVEADRVAGAMDRAAGRSGRDPGTVTAVGVGKILSRLADLGYCEKRWDFYMYRYRSDQ